MKIILEVREPNDKWKIEEVFERIGTASRTFETKMEKNPQNKYRLMQVIGTNENENE